MIEMMLEREDRRHELAEKVVNSDLPLVLYGSGDIAERAFGFLKGHGVAVQGVCVTDDYYRPHAEFHGMKVVPLSGLSRIGLKKFNVLLAFTMADSLLTRRFKTILDSGCVDRIFVLDAACTYDEPPARLDITYEYVLSHRDGFDETYFMLADQRSREAMVAFLNVRITHDCKYLLNCLSGEHYFPKDIIGTASWSIGPNETFVDCGAYAGDTIIDFARETGRRWRHVFAFEPDAGNAAALRKTVSDKGFENVTVLERAAWSGREILSFEKRGSGSVVLDAWGESDDDPVLGVSRRSVHADSIDNLLADELVSFIKMDIEGSEMEALRGAEKTITRHRPKLAICAYHKPSDMIEIPRYIRRLVPDAKIYFRLHGCSSYEHVLYATM